MKNNLKKYRITYATGASTTELMEYVYAGTWLSAKDVFLELHRDELKTYSRPSILSCNEVADV